MWHTSSLVRQTDFRLLKHGVDQVDPDGQWMLNGRSSVMQKKFHIVMHGVDKVGPDGGCG